MQTVLVTFVLAGVVLLMHGIYEQKLQAAREKVRIEYRFIPRTYYEEQLAPAGLTGASQVIDDLFNKGSPWETMDPRDPRDPLADALRGGSKNVRPRKENARRG